MRTPSRRASTSQIRRRHRSSRPADVNEQCRVQFRADCRADVAQRRTPCRRRANPSKRMPRIADGQVAPSDLAVPGAAPSLPPSQWRRSVGRLRPIAQPISSTPAALKECQAMLITVVAMRPSHQSKERRSVLAPHVAAALQLSSVADRDLGTLLLTLLTSLSNSRAEASATGPTGSAGLVCAHLRGGSSQSPAPCWKLGKFGSETVR